MRGCEAILIWIWRGPAGRAEPCKLCDNLRKKRRLALDREIRLGALQTYADGQIVIELTYVAYQ